MAWFEVRKKAKRGRRAGKAASRTAFYVRVCWPKSSGRRPQADPLGHAFMRRADAEARGRQLVQQIQAHEAGNAADPFAPADDRETLIAGYEKALAAGALGKGSKGPPTARWVQQSVGRVRLLLEQLSIETATDLRRAADRMTIELDNLRITLGWSMSTRNNYSSAIKQFGRWLTITRRWPANVLAELPQVQADAHRTFERRALTPEETEMVILAASRRPVDNYLRTHPNAPQSKLDELQEAGWRRGTYYLVAADCGWRLGEMAATTWGDLDLDDVHRGRIRVGAANEKARRGAVLPLGPATVWRLRQLRDLLEANGVPCGPDDRVVEAPNGLREHLRKDAAHAGLGQVEVKVCKTPSGNTYQSVKWIDPAGDKIRLDIHALRTSYLTNVVLHVDNLAMAQKLARHANIATTIKHYAKLRPDDIEQAALAIPRVGGSGGVSGGVWDDKPGGSQCDPVGDSDDQEERKAHG